MTRLALLALAAALAATPAAASAGQRQTVMAVRVEMQRDAGDAAMLRQINVTARAMCARIASPLFPGHEGRAWKCRREAVAAALSRRAADAEV